MTFLEKQPERNYKMKKKLLSIIAIFILLISLTSCGGDIDKSSVKIIDVALTDEDYAFVCKKNNISLVFDFNEFLAEIKENGEFNKIIAKYFEGEGEKVGYPITTGDVVNDSEKFVVATNCPFEPFEYIGDDGKIYGVDIEIAAAYAESRGLELVVKNIDFDSIFLQVENGYADIGMAGITVSEERERIYSFTNTYFAASQKLIVSADCSDFDNCKTADEVNEILSSLSGVKIGYQIGTTGGMYVNGDEDWGYVGFSNIEGKGYLTGQEAIMDLSNGNIYAVIIDEAPANALLKSTAPWAEKISVFINTMKSEYFRDLLVIGLLNTVKVAVFGLIIGIFVGTLIAVIKVAPMYSAAIRILDKITSVYVAIFRGTPMVVQLLLAYYVILPALGIKNIEALSVGITVFGLNSGAYVSEIMRGGLNSVDRGQLEAGRALGLSYNTSMIKIVIPQAIKNILPTLGNEFITLIKETSILSFITVYDIYTALSTIGSKNYEKMIPFIVMALIYIALVLIITFAVKTMEATLSKSDKKKGKE